MRRKSVAELEEELQLERDDNARLYTKVKNLRVELAELDDSDDPADSPRVRRRDLLHRRNRLSSPALCLASNRNAPALRATE
jgi:hypothetical protein